MAALRDAVWARTVQKAINADVVRGKIVLDVYAGLGFRSLLAARCGAKHVYAVEPTCLANQARQVSLRQFFMKAAKRCCVIMCQLRSHKHTPGHIVVATNATTNPPSCRCYCAAALHACSLLSVTEPPDPWITWPCTRLHATPLQLVEDNGMGNVITVIQCEVDCTLRIPGKASLNYNAIVGTFHQRAAAIGTHMHSHA